MKTRRGINGELKWRYFAGANDDVANPMRALNQQQRNEIRVEMYQIICGIKSIKAMACVACYRGSLQIGIHSRSRRPVSQYLQAGIGEISVLPSRFIEISWAH
jgi:hypothetical protein